MALVLQLRSYKGVKDGVVTSNKGSRTGAHGHLTPSPKVQGDRKGTPKPPSAPCPWPCCHGLSLGCPKSQSSHLESGPITLPCKEALPHPGEAAVHVCTHTHLQCWGPQAGTTGYPHLCWCQSRFQNNL